MRLRAERLVCRLIGCRSVFVRWFEWPHHEICSRMASWASRDADIRQGMRDVKLGKVHTIPEWDDLEADGVLCLGFARGQAGSHAHWPDLRA